jgi:hypothetical protein
MRGQGVVAAATWREGSGNPDPRTVGAAHDPPRRTRHARGSPAPTHTRPEARGPRSARDRPAAPPGISAGGRPARVAEHSLQSPRCSSVHTKVTWVGVIEACLTRHSAAARSREFEIADTERILLTTLPGKRIMEDSPRQRELGVDSAAIDRDNISPCSCRDVSSASNHSILISNSSQFP